MPATKTYDFKKCKLIFGPAVISGFSDGSGVTFTPESEIFTAKKGIDGQTTRSRSNNDDYKVTVRLMQGANSNNQLFTLAARNSLISNVVYPFKFVSPTTNEVYESAEAWCERFPDAEFSAEAGEREFTLYLPNCKVSTTEVLSSALGFEG